MTKDLTGFEKNLAQSQSEFNKMQKELDRLRIDLESAKAQVKLLHSQNLAKDSELQRAKTELNMYNPKYKRDPKVKQQREKHRHIQKDWRNKIIE